MIKSRDLKDLLNRAAAALETPSDLLAEDRLSLAEDLTVTAMQLNPDQPAAPAGSKVLVVQFPADAVEDVDQTAQELAETLDLGQYGAIVTVVEPDLADYINNHLGD